MNSKSLKPKFLTIFSFIVAGLLAIAVFFLYMERQHYINENAALHDIVNQSGEESRQLGAIKVLQQVDQQVFAGQYRQALNDYQQLLDSAAIDENMLQPRISYVKSRINLARNRSTDNDERLPPPHLIDSLNLLKQQNDSIRQISHKQSDSLSSKITELSRQIRDRNRSLEEKEQLKVTVFKNTDGATIHYIGRVDNNMANGTGTGIWESTGGVYKGEWRNNQRHGLGVYTWADGEQYEGEFKEDKREGKGSYTWPSGERYEGNWKNNQRYGQGTLYDLDGNISYEGLWEDDKPKKD